MDPDKFNGNSQESLGAMYKREMDGCKFEEDPSKWLRFQEDFLQS